MSRHVDPDFVVEDDTYPEWLEAQRPDPEEGPQEDEPHPFTCDDVPPF